MTHKKTLYYMEQLILTHRMHVETKTTNIKQVHGMLISQKCLTKYLMQNVAMPEKTHTKSEKLMWKKNRLRCLK